jgi:hypothetical protein
MEYYSRIANPRLKRITIRLSIIEIELRARPQGMREQISPEERAYRRANAEELLRQRRYDAELRWALRI